LKLRSLPQKGGHLLSHRERGKQEKELDQGYHSSRFSCEVKFGFPGKGEERRRRAITSNSQTRSVLSLEQEMYVNGRSGCEVTVIEGAGKE
jgi:hypothetical protein